MHISSHAQSVLSWVLSALDPPYSPCPLLGLIPVLAVSHVVLISKNFSRDVYPRKVVLPSHGPFLQSQLVLRHSALTPTLLLLPRVLV